jgi:hypothetical protein
MCFGFCLNHKGEHFRDGTAEKQKEGTYIEDMEVIPTNLGVGN